VFGIKQGWIIGKRVEGVKPLLDLRFRFQIVDFQQEIPESSIGNGPLKICNLKLKSEITCSRQATNISSTNRRVYPSKNVLTGRMFGVIY